MKIQILSDLHLEFDLPPTIPKTEVDLIILAGDIHNGGAGIQWAAQTFEPDVPIVYVPGNHEYYGRSISYSQQEMEEMAARFHNHVYYLNRAELKLPMLELRVLGATLWTDFSLFGRSDFDLQASLDACQRYMTDFNGVIQVLDDNGEPRRFTPLDALAMHREDLAWLNNKLAEPTAGKTIVVTHHAPHPNSLAHRFAQDRVSAGFINDLTELMGSSIDLWIHGHTHDGFDYRVKGTRVVCHPRGYVNRVTGKTENAQFNWLQFLEI